MSRGRTYEKDILCLVPDDAYRNVLGTLLYKRVPALRIRAVSFDIEVVWNRDPGCLKEAPAFLRRSIETHRHALVLFDHDGCGAEHLSPDQLEEQVGSELTDSGWEDRAAVVVSDPEIEAWVWSDSPEVDRILGWGGRQPGLRAWLRDRQDNLWSEDAPKPSNPKRAYELALAEVRKPKSNSIFAELASVVSLRRCSDRAFLRLCQVLQQWFPATSS
jgi:hypothetical protein